MRVVVFTQFDDKNNYDDITLRHETTLDRQAQGG